MSANRMTFIIYGNDFTRQILEGRHETMILDPTRLTRKDLYLVSAVALLVASLALLYWPVIIRLVYDWAHDDNYSHGFLIPPLAAYLVWERWDRLKTTPASSSAFGLVVIAGSIGVLLAGSLGAELFLSRIALVGAFDRLCALRARMAASQAPGISARRAAADDSDPGHHLQPDRVSLAARGVSGGRGDAASAREFPCCAKATSSCSRTRRSKSPKRAAAYGRSSRCSPSRSCSVTLRIPRGPIRTVIALSAIPVAILANALRVAGTGIAAHYYGPSVAEGFFHSFSGWIVFIAAFAMLFLIVKVLHRIAPLGGRGFRQRVPVLNRSEQ